MLRRIQDSDRILNRVMQTRARFEEVLSLSYQTGDALGGGYAGSEGLRRYALNLPYRYCRWLEAQATGEPIVVKMPKEAGGDEQVADWVGRIITRALFEARYENEINAVIGECCGRGLSFLAIGY